jgi:hypothetical protein
MNTVTKWFSQNYKNMPPGSIIIKHIYFSGAALRQSTFFKENMVKSRVKIKKEDGREDEVQVYNNQISEKNKHHRSGWRNIVF